MARDPRRLSASKEQFGGWVQEAIADLPLREQSFFQPGGELPARIAIYKGPILRLCRTKTELIQEIRDTVVHELGHHVGLSDEEMPY